jgi:hypothetical protein
LLTAQGKANEGDQGGALCPWPRRCGARVTAERHRSATSEKQKQKNAKKKPNPKKNTRPLRKVEGEEIEPRVRATD